MGSLLPGVALGTSIAAVLAFHGPTVVNAQPDPKIQIASNADKQAAKKLVDEGIAEQNAQHYDKAIELYKRAFALVSHPTLLFNIGQAHRLAGRPDQAMPFYERYLALSPDGSESALAREILATFHFNLALEQLDVGQEVEARENLVRALRYGDEPAGVEQASKAQERLRQLERRLGRIDVTCPTEGAEVTLDGVALFVGPGSYHAWVKTKDYELAAKKAGYQPEIRRLTVASGELQHVELRLRMPSEATGRPPSRAGSRRWGAWKPWTVAASGVALVAASGVLHALSYRNFNAYDEQFVQLPCERAGGCTSSEIAPELNDQLSLARQQQSIAVAGYIVGGSLIATGVVLLYLNRTHHAEQRAKSPSVENVAVVPTVSGDTLGILVSMSR